MRSNWRAQFSNMVGGLLTRRKGRQRVSHSSSSAVQRSALYSLTPESISWISSQSAGVTANADEHATGLGSPTFEHYREDSDSEKETLEVRNPRRPRRFSGPVIPEEMKHLDLTGNVIFDERKAIARMGSDDIFEARCDFDGKRTIILVERVRLNKWDIKTFFEKEIYVWSKLNHPNILPLLGYAFDDETGHPLLVSSWMKNGSAWTYVHSHADYNLMRLVIGIAEGLTYLHERDVIHSKINPDSILVTGSGEAVISLSVSRMVRTSRLVGSNEKDRRCFVRYMSRELYELDAIPTKQSDVWSFGMTAFALLTRAHPYHYLELDAQAMSAILDYRLPTLPEDLENSVSSSVKEGLWEICQLCWAVNPMARPGMAIILHRLHTLEAFEASAADLDEFESQLEHSKTTTFIPPPIPQNLKHLDLTDRVLFDERNLIKSGGYGDIYKARCNYEGRQLVVCVKKMRFHVNEENIKLLFQREIYVWSKLRHRNVLALLGYAFDKHSGYPLLVSTWMKNGSAWTYIQEQSNYDVMHLVSGIAEGLAYLHEHDVIHSDMKSDNVLINYAGEAVICDFGLSRMLAASKSFAKVTSNIHGTTNYLAYELLTSSDAMHSKESDVWAFGMTVYELLTRERPYGKALEFQIIAAIIKLELPKLLESLPSPTTPALGRQLWKICQLCWKPDPADRATMSSIVEQLHEFKATSNES